MHDVNLTRRAMMVGGAVAVAGCTKAAAEAGTSNLISPSQATQYPVEFFDDRLTSLIVPGAVATVIANGFRWTEGPTWDRKRSALYFSDIPNNRIHSWDAENGLGLWRAEAGSVPAPEGVSAGTNGLLYVPEEDALLVCDQSSRSIIKYDLANGGDPVPVARGSDDAPFNSPNDLIRDPQGGLFFTDPPYGLVGAAQSPLQARGYRGVYYLAPGASEPVVIDDSLNFPNGIGLSPDGETLYVAVSQSTFPRILRYTKQGGNWLRDDAVWFDMRPLQEGGVPGSADGMAIAKDGTIFATCPGGMVMLTPEAELLGRLYTGNPTGNCCFGEDGQTIFMTTNDIVVRLPVLATGMTF